MVGAPQRPKTGGDAVTDPYRAVSLGAGTQSTVMSLMADRGYFGKPPDVAIFADTGWEPAAVYHNLTWLADTLTYPIVTVTADPARSLRQAVVEGVNLHGAPWLTIPAYTAGGGMAWRQCTTHYKIRPIIRTVRRLMGATGKQLPAGAVEQWIGLSADEAHRVKPSTDRWMIHRYPLIDAGLTRTDTKAWFTDRWPDRTLPRSACCGCPYRSAREWIHLADTDPDGFADACEVDAALRDPTVNAEAARGKPAAYLHRRRIPLAEAVEADTRRLADEGTQGDLFADPGGWGNECGGVCGV